MKKLFLLISCFSLFAFDWTKPQSRTLIWNYTNNISPDISFNIYSSKDLGIPLAAWSLFTNVTATNMTTKATLDTNNLSITECSFHFLQIPGLQFFAVKAYSEFYKQESDFSNVTNTPATPVSSQSLRIQ